MGREKKKTFPARVKKKKKKKTLPTHRRRGKSTHLGPQLFRGEGGGHSQKEGTSFWSVTMTFRSKVQPAGGCFELQTLYGACRVFVLKTSKSQDILVKIGCLHKMEIWATPKHPPLCTYTNSSLASCILVQLSDLCNLGFAVHVQYGITNTCWRHARYGGGGNAGVHRTSQIP